MNWLREELSSGLAMVAGVVLLSLVGVIGWLWVENASLERAIEVVRTALQTEKKERAEERESATRAALTASENYRATEARLTAANTKAADEYKAKSDKRDALIAGLRAERVRLQADITRYTAASRQAGADPTAPRCADDPRVTTLGQLLGAGIDVAGRGQEVVGALADQVNGLQRYINEVCLAKSPAGGGQ